MSETLIPGYYNTKINNHDWVIYMGGEKYFPAYPAKQEIPGKKIVKRYLVRDSSNHNYVDDWWDNYDSEMWVETEYIVVESDWFESDNWWYYVRCGGTCEYDVDEFVKKWLHVGDKVLINDNEYEIDSIYDEYHIHFKYNSETSNPDDGGIITINVHSQLSTENNSYPLSLLESYINENEETMELDGQTYYVWRGYSQYYNESISDTFVDSGQLLILTNTLDVSLPFSINSPEFVYMILDDSFESVHFSDNYIFLAQVDEYEDGERKVKMSDVGVRIYNYEHTNDMFQAYSNLREDTPVDYFQYDGEIIEYEGQRCFVWNKYDSGQLDNYNDKILTNTIWINSLPFTKESPEFVAFLNANDDYFEYHGEYNRIEYLPNTVYSPEPIDMTYTEFESIIDINVYTRLHDEQFVPFEDERNLQYVYDGETTEWNGKTCYVWMKPDLCDETYFPYIILTNTLDITLPFNHDADYFEAALNYNDEPVEYMNMGENTFGDAGKKATFIIRNNATHYDPPIYKTVTNIIIK